MDCSEIIMSNKHMMNVTTKETATLYASASAEYFQVGLAEFLLDSATFSPTDVVLDVGCGTGLVTQQVAPLVKSIIGIDVSPSMIDHALKSKNLNSNIPMTNMDFLVVDAMDYGDHLLAWKEKFDKVVSSAVLHWCSDQRRVLRNIYETLKPGGVVHLGFDIQSQDLSRSCPFGDTVDQWLRKHPKWGQYFTESVKVDLETSWANKEEFIELFESVGFTVMEAEIMPNPWLDWDANNIKVQLRCTQPHVKHVPEDLCESLIDDVCEFLYEISPKREDGKVQGFLGRFEYLNIAGRK